MVVEGCIKTSWILRPFLFQRLNQHQKKFQDRLFHKVLENYLQEENGSRSQNHCSLFYLTNSRCGANEDYDSVLALDGINIGRQHAHQIVTKTTRASPCHNSFSWLKQPCSYNALSKTAM